MMVVPVKDVSGDPHGGGPFHSGCILFLPVGQEQWAGGSMGRGAFRTSAVESCSQCERQRIGLKQGRRSGCGIYRAELPLCS